MPTRTIGNQAEDLALSYLESVGLKLIERNVNFKVGELDLIMLDGSQLVFIEVRYRKHSTFGGALASIAKTKQRKLTAATRLYRQKRNLLASDCRFDLVLFEGHISLERINWLQNISLDFMS